MNINEKILWRLRKYSKFEYYQSNIFYYFESNKINKLNILESEDTLVYLLNNEYSFIRWGCGESDHYFGGQNPTQKYDRKLSKTLKIILKEYNLNSNYLLGIPSIYIKKDKISFQNQDKSIVRMFNSSRYLFGKYSDTELLYGDAFVFRHERGLDFRQISKLWESKDTIILTNNRLKGNFIKNETNPNSYHFIKTPDTNSFDQVEKLTRKTVELSNTINNNRNTRVLLACGPAAKVIAYNLSKLNIIAYDIGNFFQRWP